MIRRYEWLLTTHGRLSLQLSNSLIAAWNGRIHFKVLNGPKTATLSAAETINWKNIKMVFISTHSYVTLKCCLSSRRGARGGLPRYEMTFSREILSHIGDMVGLVVWQTFNDSLVFPEILRRYLHDQLKLPRLGIAFQTLLGSFQEIPWRILLRFSVILALFASLMKTLKVPIRSSLERQVARQLTAYFHWPNLPRSMYHSIRMGSFIWINTNDLELDANTRYQLVL